ncbi:MAG TPA: type II toxin-antitoxin system prevent-host-death family antitoxin [Candidatus Saccharimonadales bacterium]|nr:type II toxin-antitoxin system prevent-host-death family antitoxin [Candidatus Saccharimonadales bacterium]
MRSAGFLPAGQPGAWVNPEGIPVDLMVPEKLAGPGGKNARSARIPPHGPHALRRARGLEAALVGNEVMEIRALDAADARRSDTKVAGAAALLVAKAHKIAERAATSPHRLVDKDAHDVYRLLVDTETQPLAETFETLLREEICAEVTDKALEHLRQLFAGATLCYVRSITHREMRNQSGEILRLVASGETIQVTNNGQIAAVIVPPDLDVFTELVSRGQVRVARFPPSSLATIARRRGGKPSDEIVDQLRGSW